MDNPGVTCDILPTGDQDPKKSAEKSKCIVNLVVPFETIEQAQIAKNSIDADEVPNPDQIVRLIEVDGKQLKTRIECSDLFKLRTSLNNYIEAVLQVEKVIKRFNYRGV